jgi:hypothetical protein
MYDLQNGEGRLEKRNPFPTGSCSLYDAEGYFEAEDPLELSTHTSVDREFADLLPSAKFTR